MKKQWVVIATCMLLLVSQPAFADVTAGDRILTIGNDLTPSQKQQIETDFSKTNSDQEIVVTHADEEQALHGIVSDALIGTRAISSSLIVFQNPGYGIHVTTKNITWVSSSMYSNALLTAGVKDADITVEAPFPVSGTAALAGITKAFQVATGQSLDPTRTSIANQEMVQTAQLGQQLGNQDKAAALINELKTKMSQEHPETDDQYKSLITSVAKNMGITLTNDQIHSLMELLKKINGLHIDWSTLSKQAINLRDQMNQFFNDHPKQTNAILTFFHNLFQAVTTFFKQFFS
jgi:uncharacterized protein YpuA (DUF1002 family)